MNTVLSLIIMIRLNSLKKDNNYIIADYIIAHLNEIPYKSIKQLSEDCFVSTTSILKFCKLLGINTYSEFKNMLVSTIKTRKIQLYDKNKELNAKDILRHISSFSFDNVDIEKLEKEINQVILQIKKYKAVHIYGATFPLALASSFIEDMALSGIYINTYQDNYEISKIEEYPGVHIVITLSGRFMEVNKNDYMQITSLSYPSVLITRKTRNKGNVDYCIELPCTVSSQYDEVIILLLFDYILLQI